jgi:hypothetical protein
MNTTNLLLRDYLCAECGGILVEYYDGRELRVGCGRNHAHKGHRKADYKVEHLLAMRATAIERGMSTSGIDALIQEYQIKKQEEGMTTETSLRRYEGQTNLTEKEATHILETCWPNAPRQEVVKAALLCKSYGLNPLMKHVFLIPFKRQDGTDWVTVMGIKATRLLASRRKPYTYLDGPRVMTDDEQKTIFGKIDFDRIWAICKVGDLQGSQAPGYGFWPKSGNPYGMDKGNSPENMAFIRAERSALDRLLPGEMPDVEVVDERYQQNGQPVITEKVDKTPIVTPSFLSAPDAESPDNSERTHIEQELLGILQHKQPDGFGWLDLTALKFIGIPDFTVLPTVSTDTLKLTLAKAKALLAESHIGKAGKLFP